jgi:recombination protein RecR
MSIGDKLAEIFKQFPGIGERQAKRFVYFLMAKNPAYVEEFGRLLAELKKETRRCKKCFRFFAENPGRSISAAGRDICDICADPNADEGILMVVEKDSDLESVRKSGSYAGKYFVLGGLVPIVEKETPKFVRIKELKERAKDPGLGEIILAFPLSPQGDHTDFYVRGELKGFKAKVTSLGRGLSTGTELEYSDDDTIKNALLNRQ